MYHKWKQLARDTLTYLDTRDLIQKQPAQVISSKTTLTAKANLPQKKESPPPQKKEIHKDIPKIESILIKPQISPVQPSPMVDKIKKHLPHIRLIDSIPKMKEAALVIAKSEDLPFLKNLKKAIESRFCPVVLIEDQTGQDWSSFALVLTQADLNLEDQILLDSTSNYQTDTELKKALWLNICQRLSPKSS